MTRFLSTVVAVCATAAAVQAQVAIDVFPSVGPNDVSASFPGYTANAITGVGAGGAAAGTPGTPSYYESVPVTNSTVSVTDILATDFPSWRGTVNPSAPFDQELGNKLYFGVQVTSGQGLQLSLSKLAYRVSDTYDGRFSSMGDFSTADYSSNWVGVINTPTGPQYITSGPGTQLVDEILGIGIPVSIPLPGSSIPGGPPSSGSLAPYVSDYPEFMVGTTYTYDTGDLETGIAFGSADVTVTPAAAVPAPPGIALGAAAVGLLAVRRVRRRV